MTDFNNKYIQPTLEEISEQLSCDAFNALCLDMQERYQSLVKIEFSNCSWAYGWNIKFKKTGKNLCTVYPKENYITVLIVISQKEKFQVEAILEHLHPTIQEIYQTTKEGNHQRWLMIDVEDNDKLYRDILQLIDIRRQTK